MDVYGLHGLKSKVMDLKIAETIDCIRTLGLGVDYTQRNKDCTRKLV